MAIEKYSGVASANVTKVDGVTLANIQKVDGVDRVSVFTFQVDTSLGDGLAEYRLPFSNQGGFTYNCTVFWGDGTSDTITSYLDPAVDHTYSTGGVYDIKIVGVIGNFQNADGGVNADRAKIADVLSWGTNFNGTFNGCTGLTILGASDLPNFFAVQFFNGCSNLTSGFANWSPTGSISQFFNNCSSFTGADLPSWNTSAATDLSSMFNNTNSAFNPDITGWDTSNVTSFANLFKGIPNFNRDLGSWDTSSLTNINAMFRSASSFTNGGVSGVGIGLDAWDTSLSHDYAKRLPSMSKLQWIHR